MSAQPRATPKRIVGIDFGIARFGFAISDETKLIAMPLMVWQAEKKSEQTVIKFLAAIEDIKKKYQCEIEEIVIGMPLMMSGKSGFLADEVKHFVALLRQRSAIPVKEWDERLTTVMAERSLRESNMTRKKRTQFVDSVSATIILQSYLDSLPRT